MQKYILNCSKILTHFRQAVMDRVVNVRSKWTPFPEYLYKSSASICFQLFENHFDTGFSENTKGSGEIQI